MIDGRPRRAVWIGLLTLGLAWGSTYPAMRIALRTLPPMLLLSGRCALAAVALGAACVLRGARLPSRREWPALAVVGLLVLGLGHGLTTWSMQHTASGVAAVLGSLVPVWMALVGWAILRQHPTRRETSGLAVGLVGLVVVAAANAHGPSTVKAVIALGCAPVAWALGSALSVRLPSPSDPLVATTAQLIVAAPAFALAGTISGEWSRLPHGWSAATIGSFTYVTVVGYVVGFAVYTWLLRESPLTWLGTYAFVAPVVALVLGVALLDEPLTLATALGSGIVLLGVALTATRGQVPVEPPASGLDDAAVVPALVTQ